MPRVLVVEDDPQIRKLLVEMFGLAGIQVVTASNGKEGLECAKKETFDLIFTDYNMPEMNGEELIKQLLQEKSHPKIYLMSGTKQELEIDPLIAKEVQFLSKPFEMSVIKKILSSLK